jgi:hypothetical protein
MAMMARPCDAVIERHHGALRELSRMRPRANSHARGPTPSILSTLQRLSAFLMLVLPLLDRRHRVLNMRVGLEVGIRVNDLAGRRDHI